MTVGPGRTGGFGAAGPAPSGPGRAGQPFGERAVPGYGEPSRHLIVNVRATILLAEAFAEAFAAGSGGRLVLFSSGQRLGPMPTDLAYAASKAAVENLTRQLAPALAPRGAVGKR